MAHVLSSDDRLPWIDTPRQPTPPAPRPRQMPPTTAIIVLLSLFMVAGLGLVAYLAGQGSVRVASTEAPARPPAPRQATVTLTPVQPAPAPVVEEVKPPLALVRPAPAPVVEGARPAPARRTTRNHKPASKRKLLREMPAMVALEATRRAQEDQPDPVPVARPAGISPAPTTSATRVVQPRPAVVARPLRTSRAPTTRASRIVHIGTYRSRSEAVSAYRRMARIYPYIGTLREAATPYRPSGSRRIFYRLRLAEHNPDYARILCRNLRTIGRSCRVLPAGR